MTPCCSWHAYTRLHERGLDLDTLAAALADERGRLYERADKALWYSPRVRLLMVLPPGRKVRIGRAHRLVTAYRPRPRDRKRRFSR